MNKRSKKLRKRPAYPFNTPYLQTIPGRYDNSSLARTALAGSFRHYLAYRLLHPNLSEADFTAFRGAFRFLTVVVLAEGTLFTTYHKEHLKAKGLPFKWRDYYASILNEPINTQYFPMLRWAHDVTPNIVLLSTTPVRYSEFLHRKLEQLSLNTIFSAIVFKRRVDTKSRHFVREQLDLMEQRTPIFVLSSNYYGQHRYFSNHVL